MSARLALALFLASGLEEVHTNQVGVKVLALPVCMDRLIKHFT